MNRNKVKTSCKRGFTLIELVVVVLIIAILAAVAVPQYRLSVAKSQYATMKHMVDALVKAQEVYYLANGTYATNIEQLDINIAGGQIARDTITFPGGSCYSGGVDYARSSCTLNNLRLGYVCYMRHSTLPGLRMCQVLDTQDTTDWRNKVCQIETKDMTAAPSTSGGEHLNYVY